MDIRLSVPQMEKTAIDTYQESQNNGESFSLVITDLTIPNGMGGIELVHKIKSFDPSARVIVSSGFSQNMSAAQYREHGFDGIIAKPFTFDDLKKIITETIG